MKNRSLLCACAVWLMACQTPMGGNDAGGTDANGTDTSSTTDGGDGSSQGDTGTSSSSIRAAWTPQANPEEFVVFAKNVGSNTCTRVVFRPPTGTAPFPQITSQSTMWRVSVINQTDRAVDCDPNQTMTGLVQNASTAMGSVSIVRPALGTCPSSVTVDISATFPLGTATVTTTDLAVQDCP